MLSKSLAASDLGRNLSQTKNAIFNSNKKNGDGTKKDDIFLKLRNQYDDLALAAAAADAVDDDDTIVVAERYGPTNGNKYKAFNME